VAAELHYSIQETLSPSDGGSIMLEGRTILLVEQDLPARKLLSQSLQELGCSVVEAHSGPDALKGSEAHNGTIDLLLAESAMPGMSGLDLAEQLWRSRPDLAVVLMAASPEQSAIAHIRGLPFLRKPFTAETVAETIERILAHRHGEGLHTNSAG
jgi:two-component system cell cycle response regulator CpdR